MRPARRAPRRERPSRSGCAPIRNWRAWSRPCAATTKALLRRRSWLLALALFFTGLPLSFVFDRSELRFLMLRDAPVESLMCWAAAIGLWGAFGVVARRLRVTGL
jgi:hypothetical protein